MHIYELETYIHKYDEDRIQILLGDNFEVHVKDIEIIESRPGNIFDILNKIILKINGIRYQEGKKEVNTIAMSDKLYEYILYLYHTMPNNYGFDCSDVKLTRKIFGLRLVVRDDFSVGEIDVYRDAIEGYDKDTFVDYEDEDYEDKFLDYD